MAQRTIMFDVDGVLANFLEGFYATMGEPDPQIEGWNPVNGPKEREVWGKIVRSPTWWAELKPLCGPDIFTRINELQRSHAVVFATNRQGIHPQRQTIDWLSSLGVYRPSVIITKRKGEAAHVINANYSIDDKPENAACVHWLADSVPCRSYLLVNNSNRSATLPANVKRVETVDQFLRDIETEKWRTADAVE